MLAIREEGRGEPLVLVHGAGTSSALAAALPRCRARFDAQDGHFFFRRRVAEVLGALASAGSS